MLLSPPAISDQPANSAATAVSASGKERALIVTGNPNVGKSLLFHLLTGRYATVSNYPGTTVMVSHGSTSLGGRSLAVCDTPGINSLIAASEDEVVARDTLLSEPATVVQVGDAKNLLRALAFTLELAEVGCPTVLDLNMVDEARERRIVIDVERLSMLLGIPVVQTIAIQRWGLDRLRQAIPQACRVAAAVRYPAVIADAVAVMERALPQTLPARKAWALLWLSGDRAIIEQLRHRLEPHVVEILRAAAAQAQERTASPLGVLISQARLREAQRLVDRVVTAMPQASPPALQRLGALAMHPVWGVAILSVVLAAVYVLVGVLAAQHGVGVLEDVIFARYITPAARWLVPRCIPWAWGQALLVGEYGLLTMALPYAFAIILPIVGTFFLCFGFIEDVGYLPRLAVMANRFCRLLGLNGKAVLPLVLGLGCGTMATMTARILDSKRDRFLVTLLLALGIPCSAQLGVLMAMLAGRPPLALGAWAAVVLTVVVVVGQAAARLLPGESSPFLYEIPPLRRPQVSNIAMKTLGRLEWYIREAVPLFFLGTFTLFLLDRMGALAVIERSAEPLVVSWLGLPSKATAALLVGFLRRDFGAAGLFALQRAGQLTGLQTVVSLVTITLFVPCIAQYFMMVKEQGGRRASAIAVFVVATALVVGGLVFRALSPWQRFL